MVEYITGTTVPTLSGSNPTEEKNEVFHKRDVANEPLLYVNEWTSKYAHVEVDFITCFGYHLNGPAFKNALDLLNMYQRIGNNNKDNNKTISWSYGSNHITISDLTIPQARAFAMELEEIVTDDSNLTKNKKYDEDRILKQYNWG